MQHALERDDVRVMFDLDRGGRATSWTVDGHELLGTRGAHPVEHGMYPMAPWAGRLRGNRVLGPSGQPVEFPVTYHEWALHGTVLDAPVSWLADDDELRWQQQLAAPWPWSGVVSGSWRWEQRGELSVLCSTLSVTASSDPFWAIVGWHPWFNRVVGVERGAWNAHDSQLLVRDAAGMPTTSRISPPRTGIDDVLNVPDGVLTLAWGQLLSLEIRNSHPWFVVFDELPDFVCVEPQSAPPNGINDEAFRGDTRTPVTMTTEWIIRRGTR